MLKVTKKQDFTLSLSPSLSLFFSLSLSLSLGDTFLEKLQGGAEGGGGGGGGGGGVVKLTSQPFYDLSVVPVYPLLYIQKLTKHLELENFVEVQLFCEGFKLVSLPKVNYEKLLAKSVKNEFSQKVFE